MTMIIWKKIEACLILIHIIIVFSVLNFLHTDHLTNKTIKIYDGIRSFLLKSGNNKIVQSRKKIIIKCDIMIKLHNKLEKNIQEYLKQFSKNT